MHQIKQSPHQPLLILALCAALAAPARAQSSMQIYGSLDAGAVKRSDTSFSIGKRDYNTVGFKGVEQLGNNVKAIVELEARYELDTGALEAGQRPLFQGQSRVGLASDLGTLRIGRGLTPLQESSMAFEPFHGIASPAGFQSDLMVGGAYSSDPLGAPGNSGNRFSNAVFYNSPELMGLQINASVGSREASGSAAFIGRGSASAPQFAANSSGSANPYSIATTYRHGRAAVLLAYERNAVEHNIAAIAASLMLTPDTKLMASWSRQDQASTRLLNQDTQAWLVGANYSLGAGKVLAGYGEKQTDGLNKVKQFSLGYEYMLSKRTYLYMDLSNKRGTPAATPGAPTRVNHYSLGVHHSF